MENVKSVYIPVGQAVKTNYKTINVRRFIGNHKILLAISSIIIVLLATYGTLMAQFIQLLKILK